MKKSKYNYIVIILVGVICLAFGMCSSSLIIYKSQNYNDMMIRMAALEDEVKAFSERLDGMETESDTTEQNISDEAETQNATSVAASSGETVWKTKSGKKYHKESCGSLSKSSIAISIEEANAAGLEPCKKCFK